LNISTLALRPQDLQTPDQDMSSSSDLIGAVSKLVDCLKRSHSHLGHRAGYYDGAAAAEAIGAAMSADVTITELTARVAELEQLAETDELTGLLNRRGFDQILHRSMASADRYDEQGVLIYIDLDSFKPINDTHGHAAGDEVLRKVACALIENTRDTDYVGRLGGDEFAVLLTRTSWINGLKRAGNIEGQLNSMMVGWQGRKISVRASLGLQKYGARDIGHDILCRADEAMYQTKRLRSELLPETKARRLA